MHIHTSAAILRNVSLLLQSPQCSAPGSAIKIQQLDPTPFCHIPELCMETNLAKRTLKIKTVIYKQQ